MDEKNIPPHWGDLQSRIGIAPLDVLVTILEGAVARIETDGWLSGGMGMDGGAVCTAGAVWYETMALYPDLSLPITPSALYEAAYAAVMRHLGMTLAWWNDHYCKNGVQAAEALRITAKELANTGGVRSDAVHV